ncbi:hypothetical protein ACH3Y9_08405 [Streptomyces sp. WSLK1-5]|uniref:hypothetical protein n=1 Tax=unclassified Streptomyces TaxID=2593676 RepID=UPI0037A5D83C
MSNKDVGALVGMTGQSVGRWRARFLEHRIAGLGDLPRSGGPRSVSDRRGPAGSVVRALTGSALRSGPDGRSSANGAPVSRSAEVAPRSADRPPLSRPGRSVPRPCRDAPPRPHR